jgi:hypothetical protein
MPSCDSHYAIVVYYATRLCMDLLSLYLVFWLNHWRTSFIQMEFCSIIIMPCFIVVRFALVSVIATSSTLTLSPLSLCVGEVEETKVLHSSVRLDPARLEQATFDESYLGRMAPSILLWFGLFRS